MKLLKRKMFYRKNKYEIKGEKMSRKLYREYDKVCKQEYIMDKSTLNRQMDGEDSYICPACRFMGLKKKDNINPDHYGNSGIDVIDFCQANNLDFMQGSVIKYVFRYKNKNGLEDLEKAKEYIDRMIENLLDGEEF